MHRLFSFPSCLSLLSLTARGKIQKQNTKARYKKRTAYTALFLYLCSILQFIPLLFASYRLAASFTIFFNAARASSGSLS